MPTLVRSFNVDPCEAAVIVLPRPGCRNFIDRFGVPSTPCCSKRPPACSPLLGHPPPLLLVVTPFDGFFFSSIARCQLFPLLGFPFRGRFRVRPTVFVSSPSSSPKSLLDHLPPIHDPSAVTLRFLPTADGFLSSVNDISSFLGTPNFLPPFLIKLFLPFHYPALTSLTPKSRKPIFPVDLSFCAENFCHGFLGPLFFPQRRTNLLKAKRRAPFFPGHVNPFLFHIFSFPLSLFFFLLSGYCGPIKKKPPA